MFDDILALETPNHDTEAARLSWLSGESSRSSVAAAWSDLLDPEQAEAIAYLNKE